MKKDGAYAVIFDMDGVIVDSEPVYRLYYVYKQLSKTIEEGAIAQIKRRK
ncbi:HAD family hydrolase [Shouchella clausii]